MKQLVIVESPTKAKTISKFLGKDFVVISSFGHVRDLPKSDIGVDTENGFEPTYVVPTRAKTKVADLKKAAKGVDQILLATDEDREGEAISWHIAEILKIDPSMIKRITFHEITKNAIEHAIENARGLDTSMVDAQQARRILDRLVGYELSPLLWQKVQMGLSAGRVQSVALRLVVERERERKAFDIDEYWTIDALFSKEQTDFPGKLIKIGDTKLEKLSIPNASEAKKIETDLGSASYTVTNIDKKGVKKAPPTPLTTSKLQIESNNKLHFSAKQTMRLAQILYETGRITYMRTDSQNLAEKFLTETQEFLSTTYGAKYTEGIKRYTTKAKGAQEAHEAIRPTDPTITPESLKGVLEEKEWKMYELIWSRTVASQMPSAELERTAIDVEAKQYLFRANGSIITFDGFMKVYRSAKEKILPELRLNDNIELKTLEAVQHFTEPPARFSDATLVKILEEHGIGRPSTYAPTIGTIIDRGYVERDDNKKLFPTDIGMIVNDVLVEHFTSIVDYEFTAKMEKTLDEIAEGKIEWRPMLEAFYKPFHANIEVKKKELKKKDIMKERVLGQDPETEKNIIVKMGRYGPFVQLGEWTEEDKKAKINKPKSTSLLKGLQIDSITLEDALSLLVLPRTVGQTEDGVDIIAADGRFGPYLKTDDITASLKDIDPRTVTLEVSRELLAESKAKKELMATPIAELGIDPNTNQPILVKHGRYGPYITDGETNKSVPKKYQPEEITHEIAVELLVKKRIDNEKKGKGKKKKAVKKKKVTKKKKAVKKKQEQEQPSVE